MSAPTDTWVDQQDQDKVTRWIAEKGELACARFYTEDPRFALWLAAVDTRVMRRAYVGIMDLEDWDYWSAYASGVSPKDAAADALEYNGYDDMEDL